jgi:hypothetical protein
MWRPEFKHIRKWAPIKPARVSHVCIHSTLLSVQSVNIAMWLLIDQAMLHCKWNLMWSCQDFGDSFKLVPNSDQLFSILSDLKWSFQLRVELYRYLSLQLSAPPPSNCWMMAKARMDEKDQPLAVFSEQCHVRAWLFCCSANLPRTLGNVLSIIPCPSLLWE